MTNLRQCSATAERWLDEAQMCTTLLSGRYRDELAEMLGRTRRLLAATAPNASGQQLLLAAVRRTVSQIDRRILNLIPDSADDRPVLVHAHTSCDRLLSSLPDDAAHLTTRRI